MTVQEAGEYKPVEAEKEILEYWQENDVIEPTLQKSGEVFSFLEGPPTANAPPALHHVEVRVFKDLVNRYNYMRGSSVPRKAGWDCHGLPVEVQVEKELDLKTKKDIQEYGVDRFVEKCRDSVFTHIKEWDDLTDRLAYWIDLEDSYVTMDNNYIESVWWSLKQMWEKDLLYEGAKVVPYCPRCGTPLSSHEVAQGYKSIKEETVIVSFPVKDRDYSLLAWTTTPWTLLSNTALAVNPEIDYVLMNYKGERYVMARELAKERFPEADVVEKIDASELVGLKYYPLFNHFVGQVEKDAWKVIEGDFVTTEEGTGIVHIAPAFGEDDYNAGRENDLELINPVNEEGKFTDEVPRFEGVFVKDADEEIIRILKQSGKLITHYPYEHEYPFCWRCKTPLIYYAMDSWFIKVGDVVPKLLENNQEINWYPQHIKEGRFGKWLSNARDWSLSRNRFWGTPLPIWICGECGEQTVIGGREELAEKAVNEVDEDIDLHRPYVDEVELECSCGGRMKRVEYVIDCWYDSGSASFAQFHYPFENQDLFKTRFPYDFISEATDQTRGWFYTLLVLSTILFDEPAYKNCVVGGLLLDDNGEKMSKSHGNVIDPWELFNTVGVDAVRMQMCSTAPWNAVRFGMESLNEGVIPLLRTLWNCYSFTTKYMALDEYQPKPSDIENTELQVEDEWILASMNKLIKEVTEELDENRYHRVLEKLNRFIVEDLSRWYIKIIRDRLWIENARQEDSKKAAYSTLVEVFNRLSRLMAPIAPYISEQIYLNLGGQKKSVHHEDWPKSEAVDEDLLFEMDVARSVFEAGTHVRQQAQIKLRHPIKCLYVTGGEEIRQAADKMRTILKKQLNTKEVELLKEMRDIDFKAKPDYSVIGPRYQGKADQVAKAIEENTQKAKSIFDQEEAGEIDGFEVTPEMIAEIKTVVPQGITAQSISVDEYPGIVYIEADRSRNLVVEGWARDIIRNIQELRKKRSLQEMQKIRVEITDTDPVREVLENHREYIKNEVRASKIEVMEGVEAGNKLEIDGEEIYFDFFFKGE